MPPKGKAVAKAKAAAAPAAEDNTNAEHNAKLQEAIQTIADHPTMEGIREATPIARGFVDPASGKAGYKDVFAQDRLTTDLANAGMCEMAGNLLWLNVFRPPLAGVPINASGVDILMNRNFREPVSFPAPLMVAVPTTQYKAEEHLGDWQFITPEEVIHAYLLAAARDVGNQQKMKLWRFHMLTTSFCFVVSHGEDVHWRQARLREDAEVAFRVLVRSALQRVYEVVAVLNRRAGTRTLSYAQLADLYQQHLVQMDTSEKISTSFITDAVRLHKSLLQDDGIVQTLAWMDSKWGKAAPLNSVTKLSSVMTKTKGNEEQARWVINCVRDRCESKQANVDDGWSVDSLTGGKDKSGKGLIDLFLYKREIMQYILGPFAESNPVQSEAKPILRQVFANHAVYRQKLKPMIASEGDGGGVEAQTPDLSFMSCFRKSSEKLRELIERLVFTNKDDGLLKIAMKARKTPADLFTTYETMKEKMDDIIADLALETAAPKADAEMANAAQGGLLAKTAPPEVPADTVDAVMVAKGAGEEDIAHFKAAVERRVKAFVKLINAHELSEDQLRVLMAETSPCKMGSCTFLYDPKLVGEARTAPHIRLPPFHEEHALLVCSSFTSCRGAVGHVAAGDMVLVMDGTKKGLNTAAIPRMFQDEQSQRVRANVVSQVTIVYSQQSLMARRRATRTIEGLKQTEMLNIFTARPLSLPMRKRLHFKDREFRTRNNCNPLLCPRRLSAPSSYFGLRFLVIFSSLFLSFSCYFSFSCSLSLSLSLFLSQCPLSTSHSLSISLIVSLSILFSLSLSLSLFLCLSLSLSLCLSLSLSISVLLFFAFSSLSLSLSLSCSLTLFLSLSILGMG